LGLEGISPADLTNLTDDFVRYMRRQGRSEVTVDIYRWGIDDLIRFARDTGVIVNRDSLERWADSAQLRWSQRTFALAGTAVRRLLLWALTEDRIHDQGLARAVPTGRYERIKVPSTLTPSALVRLERYLLDMPGTPRPNVHDLRDRALFFYVKATAARVGEILQVKKEDFDRALVRQKGGSHKYLTAPPGVAALIRDYIRERKDTEPWLWIAIKPDHTIHKLQAAGVLKIWERLAQKVGVRRFTTQQLRHTAATLLIERGHDDTVVMEFLGARDTRSIQGYKMVVQDRLARARADLDVVY